jgi:TolB-like protein
MWLPKMLLMKLSINCLNRRGLFVVIAACFLVLTACVGTNNTELINSPEKQPLHVAVFPVDNPSSTHAPLEEIRQSLIQRLKMQGADVLDDAALEQFMAKHRVRYIAGLDTATSKSLSNEVGVNAVLITSVEAYSETYPPRIALISRLVSTGSRPSVLWADSVGMAGNDHPGLFGLGLIEDPKVLQHKAVGKLGDLLTGYLAGEKAPTRRGRKSFGPKESYRSSIVGTDLRVNTVGFADSSSSGDEGMGPAKLAVALTSESGTPVTVEYAVTGGTAAEGKNYIVKWNTLTFAPGETLKSIEIDIRHDGLNTGDRTVVVSLKNPTGALLGSRAVHTYTIINHNPKPTVSFQSTNERLRKSVGRARVTVQLSEVSGKDVIVPFTVGGSTKQGTDFAITPSPVVIKAGTRSAEIEITMQGNIPVEADKTIEVKLLSPDNAFLGSPAFYRLVMVRDTNPTIVVTPFFNGSMKKNAGDIMTMQFVKELRKLENFTVIEPGVVRQQFLNKRIVMSEGVSSSDINLITIDINTDLILAGKVMDYQDDIAVYGKPKVSFSVMLIDKSSKKIVWASTSYNKGDDAVTVFDWGRVNSANEMVSEMVCVLIRRLLTW